MLIFPPSPRPPSKVVTALDVFLVAASKGLLLAALRVLLLLMSPVPLPPFILRSRNNVFSPRVPFLLFNKSAEPRDLGRFCTLISLLDIEPSGVITPPLLTLPLLTCECFESTRLGADLDTELGGEFGGEFGGVLFSLKLLLLLAVPGEVAVMGTVERLLILMGMPDRRLITPGVWGCCTMEAGRGTSTACVLSFASVLVVETILEL